MHPLHLRSILAVLSVLSACGGGGLRRFPEREVLWTDPDTTPFAPRPRPYRSPEVWNTVDNTLFGPLVDTLAVAQHRRAVNVNALDEVPSSSWFTNRIDELVRDPAAFARGPCTEPPPDPAGPWTVIGGKPNGANPGFMVRHASGQRFLFKLDGGSQGERASAADVIGSRLYHAAGFNAPCNRVAYLDPARIVLAPDATTETFVGDKVPFTREMLDAALARGLRGPDGAVRGGLSQLVEGIPLGPWKDVGTRADDANDIIPHEDRRELRGSYVLGAWLGHYDAREQNSLDTWIATGGGAGYVRHYMLDFGDCLGSSSSWARVTGRRGHAHEVEWSVAFVELVTLGALDRPWRDPRPSPAGPVLGTFTAEAFEPDHYRTAYPYGPYAALTEADAAWGARILARITPALLRAVIDEARLTDPRVVTELERALLGRREKLLRRYLSRLSPLARPRIDEVGRLCLTDTRAEAGLGVGAITARTVAPARAELAVTRGATAAEICVPLPAGAGGDRFLAVELALAGTKSLRVDLYTSGARVRIAGLAREP